MNGGELIEVLRQVTMALERHADELRELDAAVGDGDLGVTLKAGCAATRDALDSLDESTSAADVVRVAAKAVARGNPSTFSALVAGGLLRAAPKLGDDPVSREDAVAFGRAFADTVATKGKAELGDKTVLDAVVPSLDALEGATDADAVQRAVEAARRGIDETTPLVGRKGRARWVGERSQGHPDPGAVLYLRFLEAWRDTTGVDA